MTKKAPFQDRHPYLVNSVLILVALVASIFIATLFIDVFTSHGQEKLVPEGRNMPLEEAIQKLEDAGLTWEITDSTNFNESFKPGYITDQDPKTGSYIKAVRPVFLYVNAMHPRIVAFPKLTEVSLSMAQSKLRDMGFKYIEVDTVPSKQMEVVKVLADGRPVIPGNGVAINAHIRITVGDGSLNTGLDDDFLGSKRDELIDSMADEDFEF